MSKRRKTPSTPVPSEIIWGAQQIGAIIGKGERATFHMLERGLLKGVRKLGSQWCTRRTDLLKNFDAAQDRRDEGVANER